MSFIFLRSDRAILENAQNRDKIIKYMKKQSIIGGNIDTFIDLYGIQRYNDELREIVDELKWELMHVRDEEDFPSFLQNFDSAARKGRLAVFLASLAEINEIRKNYELFEHYDDYDLFIFQWNNHVWIEQPIKLEDLIFDNYNDEISLDENISSIIRADIYPEIAEFENFTSNKCVEYNENVDLISEKVNKARILIDNKFQNAGVNNNRANDIMSQKLKEIYNNIMEINSGILNSKEKLAGICSKFQPNQNNIDYDPTKIIKHASVFRRDHLQLEEAQDLGHSHHLLTIKNNTSYYWENVTVYIPAIDKKLVEEINLQPYETIKKTEDDEIYYEFELLQHQGVYVMRLMFYSHIISNDCYITRIILSELSSNGKVHELHTRNFGVAISNCTIIYTSKFTGNSQKIANNFGNYASRKVVISNLTRGDTVTFVVYKDQLQLSLEKEFIIS